MQRLSPGQTASHQPLSKAAYLAPNTFFSTYSVKSLL